jgi:hypothetical protein
VHNSIPEYASTASILKPFKKNLRKRFSPQISSKTPGPQETEHKRERERERERKGKKKAPMVSSNKRGSQYFERRKTLQFQKFFLM